MNTVEVFSLLNAMNSKPEGSCFFVEPSNPTYWSSETWTKLESVASSFKKDLDEDKDYQSDEYIKERIKKTREKAEKLTADELACELYLCLYDNATHLYDRAKEEVVILFQVLTKKVEDEKAR